MEASTPCIAMFATNPVARIALTGLRLTARLSAMHGKATLDQTFVNREPVAIEAIYTFPLPEGCAVCGFEVRTDDRVLTGVVEEANAAIERYEEAVQEGHGAFLAEQERPDVFTIRAGNLKPGQLATVRISYVFPLERVDRSIRVAFPTTVAPRYATTTATDPIDAAVDGDALNPPHALHVPYGLSVDIDIDLGRPVRAVTSSSHAIEVIATTGEAPRRRVSFKGGPTAALDRDFVLNLDLEREHEPCVQAVRGAEGSYLAATFIPEFDVDELVEPAPSETIFVLDCSGSMQGESIAQAIAALELCLRSMNAGDTFNICRFGSTWQLLASEPLRYSEATLEQALIWIRNRVDLGGTELHPPLQAILSQRPATGSVRQVILLTDGQVTNEPAVIELARSHRNHTRIFSFGIGSACSAFLVKGIARATGGAAEFISAGERIDDKVLRTFGRLASPLATDVTIDWGGRDVQTLAELPPIFDGDVFSVFGKTEGSLPSKVTLACRTPAGPRTWSVAVHEIADDGGVIATLWARRMIQSMEEVNKIHRTSRASAEPSREREMLITLSKRYGLLCSLTTFVAVEHRSVEERTNGQPAVRRIPVMLAKGWGDVAEGVVLFAALAQPPAACAPYAGTGLIDVTCDADVDSLSAMLPDADILSAPPSLRATPNARKRSGFGRLAGKLFNRDRSLQGPPSPDDLPLIMATSKDVPDRPDSSGPLSDLLSLQSADGYFEPAAKLDDIALRGGADPHAWRDIIVAGIRSPLAVADRDLARVVNTVLANLILRIQFAADETSWRRAHGKAVRYLARAISRSPQETQAWVEQLRQEIVDRQTARQP